MRHPNAADVRSTRAIFARMKAALKRASGKTILAYGTTLPIDAELIDRLIDLCCTRYHRAVRVDAPEGPVAIERYVEARNTLRGAIEEIAKDNETRRTVGDGSAPGSLK
jgi:hypothetical protein